jgi:hypothetical protein
MFGRELVGSGAYFQQRTGEDQVIRLELKIQIGDHPSSLLQVLSPPGPKGHYLWTYRKLGEDEELSRVDVARAAVAAEQAGDLPGGGADGLLPGMGGLPGLLRGLQAAFDFDSAQQGRFGDLPVWRLEGRWKPGRLAKLLPEQKAAIEAGRTPDLSSLPEHLPDHVVLMLRQEDLFPCRVEYRRQVARQSGRGDGSRSLVTMELFNVELNVPIDPAYFIYDAGETEWVDETDRFIGSLSAAQ